jgi:hypothetical protein
MELLYHELDEKYSISTSSRDRNRSPDFGVNNETYYPNQKNGENNGHN